MFGPLPRHQVASANRGDLLFPDAYLRRPTYPKPKSKKFQTRLCFNFHTNQRITTRSTTKKLVARLVESLLSIYLVVGVYGTKLTHERHGVEVVPFLYILPINNAHDICP